MALLVIMLCVAAPAFADGELAALEREAASLAEQARSELSAAILAENMGVEWRALARAANSAADKAIDPKDRDRWLKAEKDRNAQAKTLADRARDLKASAAATQQRLTALRTRIAGLKRDLAEQAAQRAEEDAEIERRLAREAATKPKTKYPVKDAIGYWRLGKAGEPFVIEQSAPGSAYPYRLKAHTNQRIWTGSYEPFDEGDIRRYDKARLTFRYKPKAAEMNRDIPLWARRLVEGALEFKIELDEAGSCGTPSWKGRLYPGDVRFTDSDQPAKRSAKVVGPGKPRPIELLPDNQVAELTFANAHLSIVPLKVVPTLVKKVRGLVKRQLFAVHLQMPSQLADKAGKKIEVKIRGRSTGQTTRIELERGKPKKGFVVYSNKDPAAFGDRNVAGMPDRDPSFLSVGWLLGLKGTRLDIDPKNGEIYDFTYNGARASIRLFDNISQLELSRYRAAIPHLQAFFAATLATPVKADAAFAVYAARHEAHRRLQMLKNLEVLLASAKLHPAQKHAVARVYLNEGTKTETRGRLGYGLVLMTPDETALERELLPVRGFIKGQQEGRKHPSKLYNGVYWVDPLELHRVHKAVIDSKKATRQAAKEEVWLAATYGAYEYIAARGKTNDFMILLSDVDLSKIDLFGFQPFRHGVLTRGDHFGKKVTTAKKLMALFNVLSGTAVRHGLQRLTWAEAIHLNFKPRLHTAFLKQGLPPSGVPKMSELSAFRRTLDLDTLEQKYPTKLPKTLVKATLRAPGEGLPRLRSVADLCSRPRSAAAAPDLGDLAYARAVYGPNARIVGAVDRDVQVGGSCNLHAFTYAFHRQMGTDLSVLSALKIMRSNGIVRTDDASRHPLADGFSNLEVGQLASLLGAKWTYFAPRGIGGRPTLDQLQRYHDQGYAVKVSLELGTGLHAVMITGFGTRGTGGPVTKVQFYDPNLKSILEVPACDFRPLLFSGSQEQLAAGNFPYNFPQVFRWEGGSG